RAVSVRPVERGGRVRRLCHERERARAYDAALPAAHPRRRPHRQHGLGRRPAGVRERRDLRRLEVRRARLPLRAAGGPARAADPPDDGRRRARRDRVLGRPLQRRHRAGRGGLSRHRPADRGGHRRLRAVGAHAAVARERRRDRRQGAESGFRRPHPARDLMRAVVVTRILPVALGFHAALRDAGHEPVALLTIRDPDRRYGDFDLSGLLDEVPADLDVLMPARRSAIAPLLAAVRPDLVVCMGFPWKVPQDALAVPAHGWLNGHPSLLPADSGPILAQRTFPLGEYAAPDVFFPTMGPVLIETLREALDRLAAGEPGEAQREGGAYESFFTD